MEPGIGRQQKTQGMNACHWWQALLECESIQAKGVGEACRWQWLWGGEAGRAAGWEPQGSRYHLGLPQSWCQSDLELVMLRS